MKSTFFLWMLAVIPTTFLLSSDHSPSKLYGLWYDNYTGTKLEIKDTRKGIKVREHRKFIKKKWRTYYNMGRGVYDDCDGKIIVVLDFRTIQWRKSYGKTLVLTRNDYGKYDDYERSYRYRDRSNRTRSQGWDTYSGDWYCNEHRLNLSIESYHEGFRARERDGKWVYYNRYRDNQYRDRKGNWYSMEGDYLIWNSNDQRRKFKFSKK